MKKYLHLWHDKHETAENGGFFIYSLAFVKKTVYNAPDFAGGRGISPINPTRPRFLNRYMTTANFV